MHALLAAFLAASLAGCSPTFNWRELAPGEGPGLQALMPCKPQRRERQVDLVGAPRRFVMHVCDAGDASWALAMVDVHDPRQVAPALAQLAQASAANLGQPGASGRAWTVPGATPQPGTQRLSLRGQGPDGRTVQLETGLFSHGTWVFQASCLGPVAAEPRERFFDAVAIRR